MNLYSCRTIPSGYRIVKFDEDYNPVAIYEIVNDQCPCFQGQKSRCRHTEEILPEFIRLGRVDSGWFYDFDNDQWEEPIPDVGMELVNAAIADEIPSLIPGVKVFGFRRF